MSTQPQISPPKPPTKRKKPVPKLTPKPKKSKAPKSDNSSDSQPSEISELPSDLEEYLTSQTGLSYLKSSKLPKPTSSDPNFCFLCNLTLSTPAELEVHMSFHQPHHLFKCEICGRSYKFKRSLNKHSREVHKDEIVKRFSRRKTSKWLRTYFKTSKAEEKLFLAEMEKANMVFFKKVDAYSQQRLMVEAEWVAREFFNDSTMVYEEFFLVD